MFPKHVLSPYCVQEALCTRQQSHNQLVCVFTQVTAVTGDQLLAEGVGWDLKE